MKKNIEKRKKKNKNITFMLFFDCFCAHLL